MKDSVATQANDLWWLGVVQGIVTILFGIAAIFWPGLTLVTLVYIFSAYILVWGLVEVIKTLVGVKTASGHWWLTLIFGIIALGVGVYLVRNPNVTFATLILLMGLVLIVRGIFDIVAAFVVSMSATARVFFGLAGVIALIVGIFVLKQPVTGGVAFVWVLGLYSLILGPITIALAVDEHKALEAAK